MEPQAVGKPIALGSPEKSGTCTQIQIQIQNIFIEHNTWVYIENQEYETQMVLFNSTITKHHIVVFYLSFALEKTNWVSWCR